MSSNSNTTCCNVRFKAQNPQISILKAIMGVNPFLCCVFGCRCSSGLFSILLFHWIQLLNPTLKCVCAFSTWSKTSFFLTLIFMCALTLVICKSYLLLTCSTETISRSMSALFLLINWYWGRTVLADSAWSYTFQLQQVGWTSRMSLLSKVAAKLVEITYIFAKHHLTVHLNLRL